MFYIRPVMDPRRFLKIIGGITHLHDHCGSDPLPNKIAAIKDVKQALLRLSEQSQKINASQGKKITSVDDDKLSFRSKTVSIDANLASVHQKGGSPGPVMIMAVDKTKFCVIRGKFCILCIKISYSINTLYNSYIFHLDDTSQTGAGAMPPPLPLRPHTNVDGIMRAEGHASAISTPHRPKSAAASKSSAHFPSKGNLKRKNFSVRYKCYIGNY